jgi:hypothetical protein
MHALIAEKMKGLNTAAPEDPPHALSFDDAKDTSKRKRTDSESGGGGLSTSHGSNTGGR